MLLNDSVWFLCPLWNICVYTYIFYLYIYLCFGAVLVTYLWWQRSELAWVNVHFVRGDVNFFKPRPAFSATRPMGRDRGCISTVGPARWINTERTDNVWQTWGELDNCWRMAWREHANSEGYFHKLSKWWTPRRPSLAVKSSGAAMDDYSHFCLMWYQFLGFISWTTLKLQII